MVSYTEYYLYNEDNLISDLTYEYRLINDYAFINILEEQSESTFGNKLIYDSSNNHQCVSITKNKSSHATFNFGVVLVPNTSNKVLIINNSSLTVTDVIGSGVISIDEYSLLEISTVTGNPIFNVGQNKKINYDFSNNTYNHTTDTTAKPNARIIINSPGDCSINVYGVYCIIQVSNCNNIIVHNSAVNTVIIGTGNTITLINGGYNTNIIGTNTIIDNAQGTILATETSKGPTEIIAGNLKIIDNSLISTDTNGNILLEPNGAGLALVNAPVTQNNSIVTKTYADNLAINAIGAVTKETVGLGNVQNIKNNYNALVDPSVSADSSFGYSIGSEWLNTVTGNMYICTDATSGAAVWKQISNEIDYLTGTNVGSSGVGVYKNYSAGNFNFRNINSTSGLLSVTLNNVSDTVDLTINESSINHDNLTGYSATRHIDHATVGIAAGTGLSGGGNLTATRTLNLDINGLTGVTVDNTADYIPIYDASGLTIRKVLAGSVGIQTHSGLAGLSADDHVQYLLLAGRSGGQTMTGGTGSGENLSLRSTSHATKGTIAVLDDLTFSGKINNVTGASFAHLVGLNQDLSNTSSVTFASLGTSAVTLANNTVTITTGLTFSGTGEIIVNADPISPLGIATKQYADSIATGLSFKEECLVCARSLPAYTAAGAGVGKTITGDANGTLNVDGIIVPINERVLFAPMSASTDAGIYTVTDAGSVSTPWVLTRSTDADSNVTIDKVQPGMFTFIETGTNYAATSFVLLTNDPIVIDVTPLQFSQFSGAGSITYSNLGSVGSVGVYKQTTGNTVQFRSILGTNGINASLVADDVVIGINQSQITHANISDLSADDHVQYLLLAGRAGGQTIIGGINSGDGLTFSSTNHATKGQISFLGSVQSTNATTGTVTITGGLGVSGDINSGGYISSTSRIMSSNIYSPTIAGYESNVSVNTLSLRANGVNATGTVFILSALNVNQPVTFTDTASLYKATFSSTATDSISTSGGCIIAGDLKVNGNMTTDQSLFTFSKAIQVIGNSEFTGNETVNGNITTSGTVTVGNNFVVNGNNSGNATVVSAVPIVIQTTNVADGISFVSGNGNVSVGNIIMNGNSSTALISASGTGLTLTGGNGVTGMTIRGGSNLNSVLELQGYSGGLNTGSVKVTGTLAAATSTSAALIVSGGIAVAKNIIIGTTCQVSTLFSSTSNSGILSLYGSTGTGGSVIVADVTASTSTNSGALRVAGGVGIAGDTHIAGTATINTMTVTSSKIETVNALEIKSGGNGNVLLTASGTGEILVSKAPVTDFGIVTKGYIDQYDYKRSCHVLADTLPSHVASGYQTTKTLTATANGILVIDGIETVVGDRVLFCNVASSNANHGIYEVTDPGTVSTPWILTRANDANNSTKINCGMMLFIEEGLVYKNRCYTLSTVNPITLDVTALTFVRSSAIGMPHSELLSLTADDHVQYLLLAGRSGGQTLTGGTFTGNTLTIQSNSETPGIDSVIFNSPVSLSRINFPTKTISEVGGTLVVSGATNVTGTLSTTNLTVTSSSSFESGTFSGGLNVTGNATITGTTNLGNVTVSGTMDVDVISSSGNVTFTSPISTNSILATSGTISTLSSTSATIGNLTVNTASSLAVATATNLTSGIITATTGITSTELTVSGASTFGTLSSSGTATINNLIIQSNTASTSTNTGCATFAGGVGVSGAIHASSFNGNLNSATAIVTSGTIGTLNTGTITNAGTLTIGTTGGNYNINILPNGTGEVRVNANPTSTLGVSTKGYVDNLVTVNVTSTTNPTTNDNTQKINTLWTNTTTGVTFIHTGGGIWKQSTISYIYANSTTSMANFEELAILQNNKGEELYISNTDPDNIMNVGDGLRFESVTTNNIYNSLTWTGVNNPKIIIVGNSTLTTKVLSNFTIELTNNAQTVSIDVNNAEINELNLGFAPAQTMNFSVGNYFINTIICNTTNKILTFRGDVSVNNFTSGTCSIISGMFSVASANGTHFDLSSNTIVDIASSTGASVDVIGNNVKLTVSNATVVISGNNCYITGNGNTITNTGNGLVVVGNNTISDSGTNTTIVDSTLSANNLLVSGTNYSNNSISTTGATFSITNGLTTPSATFATNGIVIGSDISKVTGNLTISTNDNGNITFSPNGTGRVYTLQDPVDDLEISTKAYVDKNDYKNSCKLRAITLPSFTASGGVLTATANGVLSQIDGVSAALGDRILVDVLSANSGIYTVTSLGSVSTRWTMTRATDANTSSKLSCGSIVYIEQGNTYSNKGYVLVTQNVVLGTSVLTFSQIIGTGQLHNSLSGLSADDHVQYLLLAGRAGGQMLYGGTGNGDTLTLSATSTGTGTIALNGTINANGNTTITGTCTMTSNLTVSGTSSLSGNVTLLGTSLITTGLTIGSGTVAFSNTSASTSISSGAVTIAGGLGVAGSVYAGGIIRFTNTTASTNTSSGAVVISGGLGVASDTHIGGSVNCSSMVVSGSSRSNGIVIFDSLGTNTVNSIIMPGNTNNTSGNTTGTGTNNDTVIVVSNPSVNKLYINSADIIVSSSIPGTGNSLVTKNYVGYGNVCRVDKVYGNDTLGTRGGHSFLTISAAILAASAGDAILVFPGTYSESLTTKSGTEIRAVGNVTISRMNVTTNTTLITMDENSVITGLNLILSTSGNYEIIGINIINTMSTKIQSCTLDITKSSSTGTASVVGIINNTTTSGTNDTFSIDGMTMKLASSGTGINCGVRMDASAEINMKNMTIVASGTGTDIYGIETNHAGAICTVYNGFISGSTADISQVAGLIKLHNSSLANKTASSLPFTVNSSHLLTWSVSGICPIGYSYIRNGNSRASTFILGYRVPQKMCIVSFSADSRTAPLVANQTFTVYISNSATTAGTSTGFSLTFTPNDTSKQQSNISYTVDTGKYIYIESIVSNTTGAASSSDINFVLSWI